MNKLAAVVAVLALPVVSYGQDDSNGPDSRCTLRLSVHVWPDVEYAADPRFLRGLVGNPDYSLVFVRTAEALDTNLLQLSGPADTCYEQVKVMRRNRHVLYIEVVENTDDIDP
jgi:hypothetical protein